MQALTEERPPEGKTGCPGGVPGPGGCPGGPGAGGDPTCGDPGEADDETEPLAADPGIELETEGEGPLGSPPVSVMVPLQPARPTTTAATTPAQPRGPIGRGQRARNNLIFMRYLLGGGLIRAGPVFDEMSQAKTSPPDWSNPGIGAVPQ
jgi:hypothetical protein